MLTAPLARSAAAGRDKGMPGVWIAADTPEADYEAFAQDARKAGVAVTPIGAIIAGNAIPSFLDERGRELVLKRRAWSHF